MPLSETLEKLATLGVTLPNEIRAALASSLPLKQLDAGLAEIELWGRLRTTSGKDYYVAVGWPTVPYYFEGALQEKRQVYLSQNGVEWVDLPSLPADKAKFAARLTGWLTGDLAFISTVTEEPPPPPPVAEGEEPAAPAEPLVIEVTEQQRVAYIVDTISAATRITPKGYLVVNAANELARNKAYAGLSFPEKLDSYTHYAGGPLTADRAGSWVLKYNSFDQTALVRHLEWPGFAFYYSNSTKNAGSFYFGSGQQQLDIMFMI